MYASKQAIERIRRSHDLADAIRSRGVELKVKGRFLVGLCPFHEDHNPSLMVDQGKQLWNCLGACGAGAGRSGGDVIAFIMKKDALTFMEALKRLGLEDQTPKDVQEPAATVKQGQAFGETKREIARPDADLRSPRHCDLLRRVVEHYHRVFRESLEGQDYLKGRGLAEPEMLNSFEVGYSDGSLVRMIDSDTARALREIGVLTAKDRELLLGCLVFPLTLPDIGVVDLYGRHAKRDQHLFLPGPRRGVFHWQAMKGSQEIILTESVIDALTLYQAGFRNVSAIYGTQGFTADHEDLLQRFRVKRVYLCLDNDAAGSRATEAVAAKIGKLGIEAVDARVPGAKDLNALLVEVGLTATAEAIRSALQDAARLLEHGELMPGSNEAKATVAPSPLTERPADKGKSNSGIVPDAPAGPAATPSRQGWPQVTPEDGEACGWLVLFAERCYRVRGLNPNGLDQLRVNLRVDGGGRMHVETLDLYSQRSRSTLIRAAATELGAKEEELPREINTLIEVLEGLRLDLLKGGEKSRLVEIPDRDRETALQALRSTDLMGLVLSDFEKVGLVGEETALSVAYLATISRLLEEPLGIFIVSRSGAGKSSLQDAVCEFVPEESLAKYTRITGQALFYKDEMSLMHKVLAVDEERGAAEAGYSLRILQSAQELSIAATRTDPQSGRLVTQEYKVKGPVSIFLTTAARDALDFETRNRFVQISVDESAEQTRRILERQRQMDTLEGVLGRQETQAIRQKHHNMHRLLRPLHVVNPYARLLSYPDQRLQMRREQKKYLTLIKTIALLHQHQREVKRSRRGEVEVEYVEVIASDITLANRLAREVLGHSLDDLAPPTRDLLRLLLRMAAVTGRRFNREDVTRATGWTYSSVREHLCHLVDLEYVVIVSGGNGRRITYELLFQGDPDEDKRYLAGLVDVEELLARQEEPVPK